MNVLLINTNMAEGYKKLKNLSGFAPPVGLAYIASFLEKNNIKVKIIDANALSLTDKELKKILHSIDFDIIGTTAFTSTIKRAFNVLKMAKELKACTTVIGGAHATALPIETLDNIFLDIVVKGEGEVTFLEIVKTLRANRSLKGVKGIYYKNNGKIISTPERPLIENLDELPFPAYHLLPMKKYKISNHHAVGHGRKINLHPFFIIFTSRGCPFNCTFCASHLTWKRRVRYRSPENVIKEIDFLVKNYNVKNIDFYDDTFTLDKKRMNRILDLIIQRNYDINFACLSRVDSIDDEILSKLNRAGFYNIRYGIESGSPEILKRMRKGIDLEKARKAIRLTQKHKMSANAFFIFGHPGETKETAMQTINFALKSNPDFALFFNAIPLPGTDMAKMVENQLINKNSITITSQKAAFDTDELTKKEIIAIRGKAYRKFYLRPSFILKKLLKIRSLTELKIYMTAAASFIGLIK